MDHVKLFLEAPDSTIAAAILCQKSFFMGKGDRPFFLDFVIGSNPKAIKDLAGKLRLLCATEVGDFKVYDDKNNEGKEAMEKLNSKERIERLSQKMVYNIWLHCSRKHQVLSLQDLLSLYPYHEESLRIWDRHVDDQGKTTLNQEEYTAFRDVKRKEAEHKKK